MMMNFGINYQMDYLKQSCNNYNTMSLLDNTPFQQLNQSYENGINMMQFTESQNFANDLNNNFLFDSPSNLGLNDELLLSLQDLDIPQSRKEPFKMHRKQPSGSAIYGFHGRELSIPGLEPIDLTDIMNETVSESKKAKHTRRLHKLIDPKAVQLSKDYIITNNKPTAYKFPPESDSVSSDEVFPEECISFDGAITSFQYNMEGIDCILNSSIQKTTWDNIKPVLPTPTTTADNSPVKQRFADEPSQKEVATPKSNQNISVFNNPCITPPLKLSDTDSTVFSSNNDNKDNYSSPCHSNYTTTSDDHKIHNQKEEALWNEIIKDTSIPEVSISNALSINGNSPTKPLISSPTHRPRSKNGEKVSTLPPGYIDQFIRGPDETKKYICNFKECGKVFQRKYNIRSHIQTHLCDRPYECSFSSCHKRFVRQHDLHRHEKIHQTNKFSCECGKSFSRIDALRRHIERNICIGGIESESTIKKPKKKRGRPKKVRIETPVLISRIEESLVNNSLNNSNKNNNDFSEVGIYPFKSFVENPYSKTCMNSKKNYLLGTH